MDVAELLKFQPDKGPKRVLNEEDDSDEELQHPPRKQGPGRGRAEPPTDQQQQQVEMMSKDDEPRRVSAESLEPLEKIVFGCEVRQGVPGGLVVVALDVLEEEAVTWLCGYTQSLDDNGVKRMVLNFEKTTLKNQELRIKFPDNPEKFMESELDLNDVIQEMHVIATMPELYPLLVDLNSVTSLLGLLSHDNTDIAIEVVDLLQELTDVDTLHESQEGARTLTDALLNEQVVALLVQNLERLDEATKEEAVGVHNTLAIIENLTEFRPEMSTEAARQGLMQWLLKRIRAKMPFDANKLYCSEILSILLQNNDANRELLGEMEGIDVLLQQLSVFKRHDPASGEEGEMMENLFDCLCSCLMLASNRERFLRGEGLQLMNLMLREKKRSRNSALKVLDHAMVGPDGADNCHKFVDILGLRSIFPLFMKTPGRAKKAGMSEKEHEEHVCSIISSMLRNLKGQQRTRLINKFVETDCEKVDRLMELHFKYLETVSAADKKIEGEKHEMVRRGEIIDDEAQDDFYLRRLDAGLFVLQLVDYVMLEISTSGVAQIRQRVNQILNLRGGSMKVVRHIIREYTESLGDAKSEDFRQAEQKRIMDLLDEF